MRIMLLASDRVQGDSYQLSVKERRYLMKVLRLEVGALVSARDERGSYYEATIKDRDTLSLKPSYKPADSHTDKLTAYKEALPVIHVYQGLVRSRRNEDAARMMVEAGVSDLTFITSRFSQPGVDDAHVLSRISTVMDQAVQQSGSETAPLKKEAMTFQDAIKSAKGLKILLHQAAVGETKLLPTLLDETNIPDEGISIFIGPEGGFSDDEVAMALAQGACCSLLPTNILRSETAGIYAVAVIQAFWSRIRHS